MIIKCYKPEQILPILPIMHAWCSQKLKGFPYFYAPQHGQMINPSDTIYANEKKSLVATINDNNLNVGIAAGLALNSYYLAAHYFSEDLIHQFKMKGFDPETILYMGYFFIDPEYECEEVFQAVLDKFVHFAREWKMNQICYIDIAQEEKAEHSFKPHPEPWERFMPGFKDTNVKYETSWPTLLTDGKIESKNHKLNFFIKEI